MTSVGKRNAMTEGKFELEIKAEALAITRHLRNKFSIRLPRGETLQFVSEDELAKAIMEVLKPSHELVKALEAYDKAVTALTDQQLIDNQPLMSAVIDGRAALNAAGKARL